MTDGSLVYGLVSRILYSEISPDFFNTFPGSLSNSSGVVTTTAGSVLPGSVLPASVGLVPLPHAVSCNARYVGMSYLPVGGNLAIF